MSEGSAMSPLSINEGHERRARDTKIPASFTPLSNLTLRQLRSVLGDVYLIYCRSNSKRNGVFCFEVLYKYKLP